MAEYDCNSPNVLIRYDLPTRGPEPWKHWELPGNFVKMPVSQEI